MTSVFPTHRPVPSASGASEVPLQALWSLAFWISLLGAAAMFGLLSLAPRIVENQALQTAYQSRQNVIAGEMAAVDELRQQTKVLESDPELAVKLAKIEFMDVSPETRVLEIETSAARRFDPIRSHRTSEANWPSSALTLSQELVQSKVTRHRWTIASAMLLLFAFLFLTDPTGTRRAIRWLMSPVRVLLGRYRKTERSGGCAAIDEDDASNETSAPGADHSDVACGST